MLKLISRTFAFLILLVIVLFSAAVVFVMTVDPNSHKENIENVLSDVIGYPLHLQGQINLKLFPILHFAVENVLVESPKGFNQSLLQIDETTADINLLPLLKGQFNIGEITLVQPQLNLLTDSDGKTNWEKLLSSKETGSALFAGQLVIENAGIVWEDLQNGERFQADKLFLKIDSLLADKPADIALGAIIKDDTRGSGTQFSSRASIVLNMDEKTIDMQNINIEASLWENAQAQAIVVKISGDGYYDANKDKITFKTASVTSDGLKADAAIEVLSVSKQATINFDSLKGVISPQALPDVLALDAYNLPEKITFMTAGVLVPEREHIKLNTLRVAADNVTISGKGTLTSFTEQASIQGNLAVKIDTLDFSDQADADNKTENNKVSEQTEQTDSPENMVAALLFAEQRLNIDTDVSVNHLVLDTLAVNDIDATIQIKEKAITASIPKLKLFEGIFSGTFSSRVLSGETVAWQANGQMQQMNLEKMIAALDQNQQRTIQGQATVNYDLTAQGLSSAELKRSLNGTSDINVSNGRLFNPRLEKVLTEVIVLMDKNLLAEKDQLLQINTMRTDMIFADGTAVNRELQAQTPLMDITGAGKINLLTSDLNYQLSLKLNNYKPEKNIQIPLVISGTFANPKYALDVKTIVADTAKKEVHKQLDKVGETLNEELGKLLDQLKLPF